MVKGSFFSDTFEQLVELGKSTVQKTGQTAKSLTVDTVAKAGQKIVGQSSEKTEAKKTNFTFLDKTKLETNYQKQDMEKADEVRRALRHYLDLQKSEEKKAVETRKQTEIERKQKLEQEEELKKQKEQEARKKQETVLLKGKERKSIFSPRKLAKRSQVETRAGSGKQ